MLVCALYINAMYSSSANQPQRVIVPFSEEEAQNIQAHIDIKLEPSQLSTRPSGQGIVPYLEGWKAISLANEVFGFNGWSSEILNISLDFMDIDSNNKVSIGMSCIIRIHLKDGTYHDDIGYGTCENHKTKASAYEKAKKEAVTDALKRSLRLFGSRLGNCAYDKEYLKDFKSGKLRSVISESEILHANYPKQQTNKQSVGRCEQCEHCCHQNMNPESSNRPKINTNTNANNNNALPLKLSKTTSTSPLTNTNIYDDSLFENSMMISEEDLLNDDNFGHLGEAIMESEANFVDTGEVYPLLPMKRKE